jgi:transposase
MLSLDLTEPGFDASVLCEFRQRLLEGEAEQQILQPLLDLCTGYVRRVTHDEIADAVG